MIHKSNIIIFTILFFLSCSQDASKHLEEGNAAYEAKNWRAVIRSLESYLALVEVPDPEVYFRLGNAYFLTEDYEKSLESFGSYPYQDAANSHYAQYNMACAYSLLQDSTGAGVRHLESAIDLGFDDFDRIENDPEIQFLLNTFFPSGPIRLYYSYFEPSAPQSIGISETAPYEYRRELLDLDLDGEEELVVYLGLRRIAEIMFYTQSGSQHLYEREDDRWVLSVEDLGIPLPQEAKLQFINLEPDTFFSLDPGLYRLKHPTDGRELLLSNTLEPNPFDHLS
jgi:tetratricopeptide (TPR) repeat protein